MSVLTPYREMVLCRSGSRVDRVSQRCYITRFALQPRLTFARGEPFHGVIRRIRL